MGYLGQYCDWILARPPGFNSLQSQVWDWPTVCWVGITDLVMCLTYIHTLVNLCSIHTYIIHPYFTCSFSFWSQNDNQVMESTEHSGRVGLSKLLPFHMKYFGSITARTLIQPSSGTVLCFPQRHLIWELSCNRYPGKADTEWWSNFGKLWTVCLWKQTLHYKFALQKCATL